MSRSEKIRLVVGWGHDPLRPISEFLEKCISLEESSHQGGCLADTQPHSRSDDDNNLDR